MSYTGNQHGAAPHPTREIFNPKKQLGLWRLGNRTNHVQQISCFDTDIVKHVIAHAVAENTQWNKGDWCGMKEKYVDQYNQNKWLRRCLGPTESIANKKILLLMKEGDVPDRGWFKIAILDTDNNQIMFRSFHNKESEADKPISIPSQENGWYFHGGAKNKRASTFGADPKFWIRLNYIINH